MSMICRILAALGVWAAFATTALAADDGFTAPEVEAEGAWLKWVCVAVFTLAILAVAFKNPKRTHLS